MRKELLKMLVILTLTAGLIREAKTKKKKMNMYKASV